MKNTFNLSAPVSSQTSGWGVDLGSMGAPGSLPGVKGVGSGLKTNPLVEQTVRSTNQLYESILRRVAPGTGLPQFKDPFQQLGALDQRLNTLLRSDSSVGAKLRQIPGLRTTLQAQKRALELAFQLALPAHKKVIHRAIGTADRLLECFSGGRGNQLPPGC